MRALVKSTYQFVLSNKISIALFLLVGTLAAVVNFAAFSFLWQIIGCNYQVAVSIAYVLSVAVHFFANRRFTFRRHDLNPWQQMPKYLVMILINYIATMLTVHIVVEELHLSPYLGLVAAIGSTVWIGYVLLRFWVFL